MPSCARYIARGSPAPRQPPPVQDPALHQQKRLHQQLCHLPPPVQGWPAPRQRAADALGQPGLPYSRLRLFLVWAASCCRLLLLPSRLAGARGAHTKLRCLIRLPPPARAPATRSSHEAKSACALLPRCGASSALLTIGGSVKTKQGLSAPSGDANFKRALARQTGAAWQIGSRLRTRRRKPTSQITKRSECELRCIAPAGSQHAGLVLSGVVDLAEQIAPAAGLYRTRGRPWEPSLR